MADVPYLVALALLEQEGKRALPLNGKSCSAPSTAEGAAEGAAEAQDPGDDGRTLVLELLLRVWQRSEEGALRRAAGDSSLLLVELPLEALQESLPKLKARLDRRRRHGRFPCRTGRPGDPGLACGHRPL